MIIIFAYRLQHSLGERYAAALLGYVFPSSHCSGGLYRDNSSIRAVGRRCLALRGVIVALHVCGSTPLDSIADILLLQCRLPSWGLPSPFSLYSACLMLIFCLLNDRPHRAALCMGNFVRTKCIPHCSVEALRITTFSSQSNKLPRVRSISFLVQ